MSGEMSGSTELVNLSSLLNSCITACSSHLRGCEEIIVNNLRESVQRVISHVQNEKESVQAFSEENTLTSECLMSLLTVLGDCDSILCSEILSLFNILALERSPAVSLYGLGALDTLIYLLDEHTHPLQVLNLIGKITKHIKCGAHEERVDRLLTIVTNNVLTNDMTLKPSLYTMVNLTSGSVPVQMHLRSLDRSGMLRKKILKLVCHDDNEVSIGALAALTSTGMADEFDKLISSDKNLDQILKLCFSMIITVCSSETFSYVVDLLIHFLNNKRVQQFLINNDSKLDSFVSKTACLLTKCQGHHLSKLFELLLALASIPTIRILVTRVVFAPVQTSDGEEEELLQRIFSMATKLVSSDHGASVLALKLITYIYESLSVDASQAGSTCHLNFQFLTECLTQNELTHERSSVRSSSADKILASLCLLEVLVSSGAFSSGVLSEIEPSTITDIVDYQLQKNPVAFNWNNKLREEEVGASQSALWSKTGVEVVLKAISVIIEATERNESYTTCLHDYLQKTSLVPFLATGLSSTASSQVQLSLKIISKADSLSLLQTTVLSDVMSSINSRRPHSESPRNTQTLTFDAPLVDDCKLTLRDSVRDNIVLASPGSSPRGDANVIPSSQSCNRDLAERLQHLKVEGDNHMSDIISVYELKLKAQKTKEAHLEDLVQAKTMALSQADRLIHQYKSRLAQVDSESQKLRSIVHESERRSESYREKMNEMLVDRERLHAEMERLLQDSRKLDDTLRTLASVKRELVTLNDIHTTLTQFTDNLKQQHRELESEYSLLKETERKKSLTITEKDTKISELRKNIKKLEDQINQQREENKRLEKSLKEKEEKLKKIFDTLK